MQRFERHRKKGSFGAALTATIAAVAWSGGWLAPQSARASAPAAVNYGRPFEPPTRPAFIPVGPNDASPFGPDTVITHLPAGPVAGAAASEEISLVPYGCAKFRVSMFPVTERALKALATPGATAPLREKAARG